MALGQYVTYLTIPASNPRKNYMVTVANGKLDVYDLDASMEVAIR